MTESLTMAEVAALTGDDISYWLSNQFMSPDMLADKVRWWITTAVKAAQAKAWDEGLNTGIALAARGYASPNPYRAALVAPSRVPGEET